MITNEEKATLMIDSIDREIVAIHKKYKAVSEPLITIIVNYETHYILMSSNKAKGLINIKNNKAFMFGYVLHLEHDQEEFVRVVER